MGDPVPEVQHPVELPMSLGPDAADDIARRPPNPPRRIAVAEA